MTKYDYSSACFPNVEFTAEDIAANREGRLTALQEQMIGESYQTRQRDASKTAKWFLIFFVGILVVGAIIEYSKAQVSIEVFITRQGPIFIFITVALLALVGVSLFAGYLFHANLRSGRISVAEGTADVLAKLAYSRGTYMRYELRLKRGRSTVKLFRLANQQSLDHFQTGKNYRVYYIEYYQMPIVLSAETLD